MGFAGIAVGAAMVSCINMLAWLHMDCATVLSKLTSSCTFCLVSVIHMSLTGTLFSLVFNRSLCDPYPLDFKRTMCNYS